MANITIEEARAIADAKLKYKERQISMMEDRQRNHASAQREKLLNKMKRENPLRRIEDADHASAIMAASRRHRCSDYEYRLEEARFLAEIGEIDRDEVKDYARENMRFAGKKVEK